MNIAGQTAKQNVKITLSIGLVQGGHVSFTKTEVLAVAGHTYDQDRMAVDCTDGDGMAHRAAVSEQPSRHLLVHNSHLRCALSLRGKKCSPLQDGNVHGPEVV